MHTRRRRSLTISALTLATVAGLGGWGWQKITLRQKMAQTARSSDSVISSELRAVRAAKLADPHALPALPTVPAVSRIDTERVWEFQEGGQPLSITLALDEAMLRAADGEETLTRLEPPATEETLPARRPRKFFSVKVAGDFC